MEVKASFSNLFLSTERKFLLAHILASPKGLPSSLFSCRMLSEEEIPMKASDKLKIDCFYVIIRIIKKKYKRKDDYHNSVH